VKIVLRSGAVYIPGVRQRITVQVADPVQRRWGFEMTARLNSDLEKGQAGDFTPIDNMTQVICEDGGPKPCASGVSFIQHTSAGSRNGLREGATFQFDWTPPATNAGPVTLYVAGNAANGDGAMTGDLIYTSNVQLTPAVPVAPTVTAGNIVSGATLAPGAVTGNSWVTVYGSNLAVTNRGWVESDFVNGGVPFSLDGVSVVLSQFNAPRLAYVGYVSPTQVNFLIPTDMVATATTLQVRNPAGASAPVPITIQGSAPQLFTSDGKTVLGTHASGSFVGGAAPATPGETIAIYGTGMGVTNPAQIPGQIPTDPANLATLPTVTIGGTTATVSSAGIVAGNVGVYRVTVQVPADATTGDLPVIVRVGNANSAAANLPVRQP